MKKITKIAALAALSAMFFASCSNITDGSVEGTQNSESEETGKLSIEITSAQKLIDFSSSSSRTILPDAQSVSLFDFYLAIQDNAKNENGYTTVKKIVVDPIESDASGKTGIVSVTLSKSNYNFKLYAVKKDAANGLTESSSDAEVANLACLVGYATADLRYNESVSFYLRPDSLSTKGNVELKLYKIGEWSAVNLADYKISARLEYLKTLELDGITYNEGDPVATTGIDIANTVFTATAPDSANYSLSDIAPGTYNFVLAFTNSDDEKKVFEWSDTIVILPGETTARAVAIPCVINTIPNAPSAFKAGYIDALKSKDAGYYDVEFVWEDESDNEKNFQIEWLKVPDAVTLSDTVKYPANVAGETTDDDKWNLLVKAAKEADATTENVVYGYDADGAGKPFESDIEVYVAGSLGRNRKSATFKAAYGCRYAARLRALNNVGESEWVYATINENIEADADANSGAKVANGFISPLLNRYKVVYTVGAGKFFEADGTTAMTVDTVYFESEDKDYVAKTDTSAESGKIATMKPDGKTNFAADYKVDGNYGKEYTTPYLILSESQPWNNWTADGSTDYGKNYYGGFKNLYLTAMYKLGTVEIVDYNDYVIVLEADHDFLTSAAADDTSLVGKSIKYTTAELAAPIVWTVKSKKADADNNPTYFYDEVSVEIKSTRNGSAIVATYPGTRGTDGTWTISMPLSSLNPDVYQATIKAQSNIKNDYPFTETVILNITD